MNCYYCGTKVAGLEVHVLPRGYEQPTPRVFHRRCLSEYEANALSRIEHLENLLNQETFDETARKASTQRERIKAILSAEDMR